MGAAVSKGTRGSAARRYPSRASIPTQNTAKPPTSRTAAPSTPLPTVKREEEILRDGADPDLPPKAFASRLHELGIVSPRPGPTLSSPAPNTRPDNATLSALGARRTLEQKRESDDKGAKTMLDIGTIVEALKLRSDGVSAGQIEARLGLEKGMIEKLGPAGVIMWAKPPGLQRSTA